MRWSKTHVFTLKNISAKDEIPSYKLMIRAGFIKKVTPGIYTYQNMALKVLQKIKQVIREELDKRDCIEILMPMVHPRSLWEESGRWRDMGDALLKFQNRNGHEFCLSPTHEEVVTDLIRHDLKSYKDFPKNLYQIQTKYRDEIRPRFGLLRGREFIMKDAYSFDLNKKAALKSYQKMYEAYCAIFNRLELNYKVVQADAGSIGGNQSQEFHVLAKNGEDALMVCDCQHAYNLEIAPVFSPQQSSRSDQFEESMEKFATDGIKTIKGLSEFTGIAEKNLVKTLFFKKEDGGPFCVLLRGSHSVAPTKIKSYLNLNLSPEMLSEAEVLNLTGAMPGSCGPVGLNCPILIDNGLKSMGYYIVGANKDGFHLKNVVPTRDFKIEAFGDFRMATQADQCPKCLGQYKQLRGIEVGHIFYLGNKYSKAMKATYADREGQEHAIEMGCYGIGVSRALQAIIEQKHDKDGMIWPISVTAYHVHICLLDRDDQRVSDVVQKLEQELEQLKIGVFVDDRDERPGVKFKDADLLGFPFRIVVGKRNLIDTENIENQKVELVERSSTSQIQKLDVRSAIAYIDKIVQKNTL